MAHHSDTPVEETEISGSTFLLNEYDGLDSNMDLGPLVRMEPPLATEEKEYFLAPDDEWNLVVSSSSSSTLQEDKAASLRYPPCVVCGGKASGLHYGCYTCEACKNFFRRYLMRNELFHCKKGGNCKIVNKTRGNCSGCRLKKCLAEGMSKDKSKIGRYTHAQRTETINEVKKLEGKFDEVSDSSNAQSTLNTYIKTETSDLPGLAINLTENHELAFTESDTQLIETLTESMDAIEHFGDAGKTLDGIRKLIEDHYQNYLAKVKLFGPLKAIPKEEYFTLLKMHNIDLDQRWDLFKREANNCNHIVKRYCEFAYKIPGFKELAGKDQENLLKFGHCEFFLILMHQGYMEEYKIFLEMNGVPSHIEEAADKIFSRTLVELQCELFVKWQKVNLAKEEMAVLIAMSLVCTDRCELIDLKAVDKVHSDLTNLLCKVLYHLNGKSWQKKFAKIIDCLTAGRQGGELYFKEYQEMSQNQMITDAAPNFPVLCPELPNS